MSFNTGVLYTDPTACLLHTALEPTNVREGQVLTQCKMKPGCTLRSIKVYGSVQKDWGSPYPCRMDRGTSRMTRLDTSYDSDSNYFDLTVFLVVLNQKCTSSNGHVLIVLDLLNSCWQNVYRAIIFVGEKYFPKWKGRIWTQLVTFSWPTKC